MGTARWLVTRCENCGMLNVISREKTDGSRCGDCEGGPLTPMGYAILQGKPMHEIYVGVSVEREGTEQIN